jgi:hypothetical protein
MATANTVLEIAFKELGYVEKPVNITKYGAAFRSNPAQWCGLFVMWVFRQAHHTFPNTAYTPNGVMAFKNMGAWLTTGNPIAGDILFYDFPDDHVDRVSHVGICVKTLANGQVLGIEGNTTPTKVIGDERNGGQVSLKLRDRSLIVGWGRPMYKPSNTETISNAIKAAYDYEMADLPMGEPVKKAAKKATKKAAKK